MAFYSPAASSTSNMFMRSGNITAASHVSTRNNVVLAIHRGRGDKGELKIGMACIPAPNPTIVLCEFVDTQSFQRTISKIEVFQPTEIITTSALVSETALGTHVQGMQDCRLVPIDRKLFHERQGLDQLKEIGSAQYNTALQEASTKSVALAAVAALIRCMEITHKTSFSPKSLRIEVQSPEQTLHIDSVTCKHLELVVNNHTLDQKNTLLGLFSKELKTPMGLRLLRNNILQPMCDQEIISQRLECIEELLENGELLYNLQAALAKLPVDVDHMIYSLAQKPNYESDEILEQRINLMISLKHTLNSLQQFVYALEPTENEYLASLREAFQNPVYQGMADQIAAVINPEVQHQKGASKMKMQRTFAVRSNINPLLDVARKVYCEIMSDTNEYVLQMSREHNLPLEFIDSPSKGFHLRVKLRTGKTVDDLNLAPQVFIRVRETRRVVTFTTEALIIADRRIREVSQEILNISYTVVSQLVEITRANLPTLYAVAEAVSKLDVIQALALYAAAEDCHRPSFSTCCTAVERGRHPILQRVLSGPMVANSTILTVFTNVKVITGPNMSGKSTYLKQVALLQILAQIGSYLPAESATVRMCDYIFSRIGTDDCLEENASTFAVEMSEMSYIMDNVTSNSLVLIDELGRSTSHEEGAALAWACLEKILPKKCFILFATHFFFLTKLESMYLNVLNYQLITSQETDTSSNQQHRGLSIKLHYTHVLKRGVTDVELYGLNLAKTCAFPDSFIRLSYDFAQMLVENRTVSSRTSTTGYQTKQAKYLRGVLVYLRHEEPMVANNEEIVQLFLEQPAVLNGNHQEPLDNDSQQSRTPAVSMSSSDRAPSTLGTGSVLSLQSSKRPSVTSSSLNSMRGASDSSNNRPLDFNSSAGTFHDIISSTVRNSASGSNISQSDNSGPPVSDSLFLPERSLPQSLPNLHHQSPLAPRPGIEPQTVASTSIRHFSNTIRSNLNSSTLLSANATERFCKRLTVQESVRLPGLDTIENIDNDDDINAAVLPNFCHFDASGSGISGPGTTASRNLQYALVDMSALQNSEPEYREDLSFEDEDILQE